jgi:type VI secretion system protein VasI
MTPKFLSAALALLMLLALAEPAVAYDDLAGCAAIEDGTDRLACYDELAGRNPADSKLTPTTGKWVTTKMISNLNGRPSVSIMLPAENLPNDGASIYGKSRLIVSCDDRQTNAYVAPQRLMSLSNDGLDVLFRVDDGPEKREIWQVSGDGRKIYQPRPIPWIKALMAAAKLDVKIIIYGRDNLPFTFDVRGLELAVDPVRKLCGW